ncbi:MAG: Rieske 2Fe-2S domain-containing protein [Chitinophagaceae bacterium]|nr:Rieske 2Fe-2S domain-containing protein [Chitinophagaceae bacterium]
MKKIAEHPNELNFGDNNIAVVEVDGKKICVGLHNQKYFAFAYKCPHAGGILADGFIDPLGRVVCPLHRYRFDPYNGINVSGEGFYLRHWPVEWNEKGVFIQDLI